MQNKVTHFFIILLIKPTNVAEAAHDASAAPVHVRLYRLYMNPLEDQLQMVFAHLWGLGHLREGS